MTGRNGTGFERIENQRMWRFGHRRHEWRMPKATRRRGRSNRRT